MKIAWLFLATLLLPAAVFCQASEYVGYRYKSVIPETVLPNGVKNLGGGLVGDFYAKPVWGVAEVSKGKVRMLWLEKATAEDERGVTEWEISDVLSFPNIPTDQELLIASGPGECKENGKTTNDLVVHVQFLKKQRAYKTLKAWRADVKAGRFVALDAKNVKCRYDEP